MPATGKTTVCIKIKEDIESCVLFSDVTKLYKKSSFVKKISSFSLRNILTFISMFHAIGRSKNRKLYYYLNSIKIDTIYNFFEKYLDYRYLLIDHGILQNSITIEGFEKVKNESKINQKLIKVLKRHSKLKIIYIDGDIEELIKRITKRNRNVGRLDLIINDTEKLKETYCLIKTKFDRYEHNLNKTINIIKINMNDEVVVKVEELIKKI